MWFMIVALYPVMILVCAFTALNGWIWGWLGVFFFGFAEFLFLKVMLPKPSVEKFRGDDGVYRVPISRGLTALSVGFASLAILFLPVVTPVIAIVALAVIAPGAAADLWDAVSAADWRGAFEAGQTLHGMWELLVVVLLATPFWLWLGRNIRSQARVVETGAELVFDEDGLSYPDPRFGFVPWEALTDARIWHTTGVRLDGDGRIDHLRRKVGPLASHILPSDMDGVAFISLDSFPVSAKSVVALIRSRIVG